MRSSNSNLWRRFRNYSDSAQFGRPAAMRFGVRSPGRMQGRRFGISVIVTGPKWISFLNRTRRLPVGLTGLLEARSFSLRGDSYSQSEKIAAP